MSLEVLLSTLMGFGLGSFSWVCRCCLQTVKNAEYVPMEVLLSSSNFISIHVPLLPATHHLINKVCAYPNCMRGDSMD
jgi:hypothetical protein